MLYISKVDPTQHSTCIKQSEPSKCFHLGDRLNQSVLTSQNDSGNGGEEHSEGNNSTGDSANNNQSSEQDLSEGRNENNQGANALVFITKHGRPSDEVLLECQAPEIVAPAKNINLPLPCPYLLKPAAGSARITPLPSLRRRQSPPLAPEVETPSPPPYNTPSALSQEPTLLTTSHPFPQSRQSVPNLSQAAATISNTAKGPKALQVPRRGHTLVRQMNTNLKHWREPAVIVRGVAGSGHVS